MQPNLTDDQPLIDKLYDLLVSEKQARSFYDLANVVVSSDDYEENERIDALARLYTTLNMDGRFLSVGQNFWGLKSWYPVEQHDEEVASKITPKRKRKNVDDDFDDYDDDDLVDDFDDIDDDDLDEDFDDDDDDLDEDFDDEDVIDEDYDDDDDDTDDDDDDDLDEEDIDLDVDSDEDED